MRGRTQGGGSPRPECPMSPALLPQCPTSPPAARAREPGLGSLTRGTFLCLELYSAAQRTELWLAEGGAPTIPAPAVVLTQLPRHRQVCRADFSILHHHAVCCDCGSQCILARYTNPPPSPWSWQNMGLLLVKLKVLVCSVTFLC